MPSPERFDIDRYIETLHRLHGVTMDERETSSRVVATLLFDMLDRRGFRQLWDSLETDTRQDIVENWRIRIESALKPIDEDDISLEMLYEENRELRRHLENLRAHVGDIRSHLGDNNFILADRLAARILEMGIPGQEEK
jgi:hypothetical protein